MVMLAADVVGTKVAVALVTAGGEILAKIQQPTDLNGPAAVVDQIAAMASHVLDSQKPLGIGICVPAVLEHQTDRVIWAPNLPGWEEAPVPTLLGERLGVPVFVEYDGHAAVLGEWWVGAGSGYHDVAGIIIGTGIGGGFVVGGQLWQGRDRLAGAVGWIPVRGPDGLDHWEQLASGTAIARRAQAAVTAGARSVLGDAAVTAKDVFNAARQGDALAKQLVADAAELIGQGIATVISLANPQIVILGGSIGQQGDLILETVQTTARRWAQPFSARHLPIVCSTLGEEAGLLGAAYAAFRRIQTRGD